MTQKERINLARDLVKRLKRQYYFVIFNALFNAIFLGLTVYINSWNWVLHAGIILACEWLRRRISKQLKTAREILEHELKYLNHER